jgi:hypothetical protein
VSDTSTTLSDESGTDDRGRRVVGARRGSYLPLSRRRPHGDVDSRETTEAVTPRVQRCQPSEAWTTAAAAAGAPARAPGQLSAATYPPGAKAHFLSASRTLPGSPVDLSIRNDSDQFGPFSHNFTERAILGLVRFLWPERTVTAPESRRPAEARPPHIA